MSIEIKDDCKPPQEAIADAVIRDIIKERRTERRWKLLKRGLFVLFFLLFSALALSEAGYPILPPSDRVALVKITGPIAAEERASVKNIVPALEAAFADSHVKMVALEIDSPGGAPFEAERIAATLDFYRDKTKIPAYAFIGNTGASAAYLIALHADKIYAGRFSLVGSIGAVIETWDFHKLMEKADIGQRVYASGVHKNMLNPFAAMTPESERKAQDMVDKTAATFAREFRRVRAGKLKEGVNYFTGEVWGGEEALALGIVDAVDSLENVVRRDYGADMKVHDFGPRDKTPSPFHLFSTMFVDHLVESIMGRAMGLASLVAVGNNPTPFCTR